MTRVVAVVASDPGGHTDALAGLVLAAAAAEGATVERIHLGRGPLDPALVDRLGTPDAVVLATPMLRGSSAGVLKEFLDRVDRGTRAEGYGSALEARPVALVASGATHHNFLGLDPLAALLVRYFAAWVVPPALYATREDDAAEPAARLGRALVALAEALARDGRLREIVPQY